MSIDRFCIHCDHAITHTPVIYCSRNKEINLVTGEEYFLMASTCREYEKYCGQRGIYFVSKQMTDDEPVNNDAPF